MSKTYTLNATLNTGHLGPNSWADYTWKNFVGWSGSSSALGKVGYDSGAWYYATNMMFDTSALSGKTITSVVLEITTPTSYVYGDVYICFKQNGTATSTSASAQAWLCGTNAGVEASRTDSIATTADPSFSNISAGTYQYTLKALPKYGLTVGPSAPNLPGTWVISSAKLIVTTNETDYSYTLAYNANGGSGVPSSQTGSNTGTIPSYTFTISSTTPTRTGYTFLGWSKSSSATSASYSAGGSITVSASGTTILYAVWNINTYTVSYYKGNNGTGTNTSDTKTYGVNLTLKGAIFTRTGYTQTGWSSSDGGSKAYDTGGTYSTNAAATLYPYWKINTYTVSYNAGGGTGAPASQTKTYGQALTLSSTTPTWAGHTFSAWNTKSDGTGTSYAPGASYTANAAVTLYAIWDTNTYTVTFNANGGSGAPSAQTKTYNVSLTLSSTKPTRTGYNFVSWNTKSDGTGTTYISGGSYTANAAVTLYAQWTLKTYTVTYNANGGSGAPGSQTKTYGVNLTLSATQPTRSGYTFVKWNTAQNGSGTDYSPSGTYSTNAAVTLYAQWTESSYTVTYNSNGVGTAPASQTKEYNVALTLAAAITATGSTMVEWNTKADGAGTSYTPGGSYTANAAVTLYAIWTASTYTITFDADGGTVSPETKTVTWGQAYGTLPTPTKSGETFYGWFDPDDVLITASSPVRVSGNTTLTAAWTPRSLMRVKGSDGQLHAGALYVKGSDGQLHMAVAYVKGSDGQMHING